MPPRLAAHGEPELAAVLTIDDLTGMHREDLHATDGQRGCVGKAVVGRRPEHDGAIEREPGDVDRAQVHNRTQVVSLGKVVDRVQERGSNVLSVRAFKSANHNDTAAANLVHARHVAAREPDLFPGRSRGGPP